MRKCQKKLKTNGSGQLLIITALVIAVLISSVSIYVYENSEKTKGSYYSLTTSFVHAIKQSTRNTMLSSLSNVSNGGERTILADNLNKLSQVLQSLNYYGTCHLAFTPCNNSNYDDGVWVSWNTSDVGVSSAYANFTLKLYDIAENLTLNYNVNVSSAIIFNGYYTRLVGDQKQVNLTCDVYNEGESSLAKSFIFYYQSARALRSWIPVDYSNSLSIIDYGNGTCYISFTVSVPSEFVEVSAHIVDLRNIFVSANTTCYEA